MHTWVTAEYLVYGRQDDPQRQSQHASGGDDNMPPHAAQLPPGPEQMSLPASLLHHKACQPLCHVDTCTEVLCITCDPFSLETIQYICPIIQLNSCCAMLVPALRFFASHAFAESEQ